MSRRLESALAAERKAAARREAIERHETLVQASRRLTALIRDRLYAEAMDEATEMQSQLLSALDAQSAQEGKA